MNSYRSVKPLLLNGYYWATLGWRELANRRRAKAGMAPIAVLFYHRIADDRASPWTHSNRLFERQIRWLQKHCELISLEEAQRRIRGGYNSRVAVCITFDDGYWANCDRAIPLLMREGIPCTYFVSYSHVATGRPFPHDQAAATAGLPNSADQLRWMAKVGVEIGAHTRSHADLGIVTDSDVLYDEVVAAGRDIETLIGQPVRYFAFPYGMPRNLNRSVFQLAHDFGYEGVCSAYGDYNMPGDDPFHIRRIHVDDMAQLRNWCSIDPRHLTPAHQFSYSLSADDAPSALEQIL